jgi:hypothetical protein
VADQWQSVSLNKPDALTCGALREVGIDDRSAWYTGAAGSRTLLRRRDLDHFAKIHDGYPVGYVANDRHVVADKQISQPSCAWSLMRLSLSEWTIERSRLVSHDKLLTASVRGADRWRNRRKTRGKTIGSQGVHQVSNSATRARRRRSCPDVPCLGDNRLDFHARIEQAKRVLKDNLRFGGSDLDRPRRREPHILKQYRAGRCRNKSENQTSACFCQNRTRRSVPCLGGVNVRSTSSTADSHLVVRPSKSRSTGNICPARARGQAAAYPLKGVGLKQRRP